MSTNTNNNNYNPTKKARILSRTSNEERLQLQQQLLQNQRQQYVPNNGVNNKNAMYINSNNHNNGDQQPSTVNNFSLNPALQQTECLHSVDQVFVRSALGGWTCRYCNMVPFKFRAPGAIIEPHNHQDMYPDPAAVEYHLSLCNGNQYYVPPPPPPPPPQQQQQQEPVFHQAAARRPALALAAVNPQMMPIPHHRQHHHHQQQYDGIALNRRASNMSNIRGHYQQDLHLLPPPESQQQQQQGQVVRFPSNTTTSVSMNSTVTVLQDNLSVLGAPAPSIIQRGSNNSNPPVSLVQRNSNVSSVSGGSFIESTVDDMGVPQIPPQSILEQHRDDHHTSDNHPGGPHGNITSNNDDTAIVNNDNDFTNGIDSNEEEDDDNDDEEELENFDHDFLSPDDRDILTRYFFYLMRQMKVCRFTEADRRAKGGSREHVKVGFAGMQCIHCDGTKKARKFFWSSVDRIANSFSEIPGHILKCPHAPEETRKKLAALKETHPEELARFPRGSQKIFLRRLWRRIHRGSEQTSDSQGAAQELVRNGQIILAISEDEEWLSDHDCFIRKNIQVFEATDIEVAQAREDRKYGVSVGQIGLRCIHCGTNRGRSMGSATIFPTSVMQISKAVRDFKKYHFDDCKSMPPEVRQKMESLTTCSSLNSIIKRYDSLAADALGLVDTRNHGIRTTVAAQEIEKLGDTTFVTSSSNANNSNEQELQPLLIEEVAAKDSVANNDGDDDCTTNNIQENATNISSV